MCTFCVFQDGWSSAVITVDSQSTGADVDAFHAILRRLNPSSRLVRAMRGHMNATVVREILDVQSFHSPALSTCREMHFCADWAVLPVSMSPSPNLLRIPIAGPLCVERLRRLCAILFPKGRLPSKV